MNILLCMVIIRVLFIISTILSIRRHTDLFKKKDAYVMFLRRNAEVFIYLNQEHTDNCNINN